MTDLVATHWDPLGCVESYFGEPLSPDLLVRVTRLEDQRLFAFADAYLRQPTNPPTLESSPDELTPFVAARASTFSLGADDRTFTTGPSAAGIDLSSATDPARRGSGSFSNAIVRALLYSHGIAIDDPVYSTCQFVMDPPIAGRYEVPPRRLLETALLSMAEVAELIAAGVLRLVPPLDVAANAISERLLSRQTEIARQRAEVIDREVLLDSFEETVVDAQDAHLQQLWLEVRGGNRRPPIELVERAAEAVGPLRVERFLDALSRLHPSDALFNAIDVVGASLAGHLWSRSALDLYLPTRLSRYLFHSLGASKVGTGSVGPRDLQRMSELAHLEVPYLHRLANQDLLVLRRDSDAFAGWRAALGQALDFAHRERARFGEAADVLGAVNEILVQARNRISSEVRGSKILSARAAFSRTFVAGVAGGAIAGMVSGPEGAILGAAGSATAQILERVLGWRSDQPGAGLQASLQRHYLTFAPPPDTRV